VGSGGTGVEEASDESEAGGISFLFYDKVRSETKEG
jgi:hypothetical protein